jgi:hypothetical protein
MRHPIRRFDATWQTRICFVLAGAIFMLSQFIVAAPQPANDDPARNDVVIARGADSAIAANERDDARVTLEKTAVRP